LCNDDPDGDFEVAVEANATGTIEFCVENNGAGFYARLTVCFQAKLYVKVHVDVWWLPTIDRDISLYESDNHCGNIFNKSL